MTRSVSSVTLMAALVQFVVPSPAQGQDPSVRTVVDRVVQAYGGARSLKEVESILLEGAVTAHTRRETGRLRRIVTGPGAMEIRLEYPSGTEIRVLREWNGLHGSNAASLAPAQGPLLGAMRLQAARASVPWIMVSLADGLRLRLQPEGVIVLEGELAPGLTLRFFVSRDTYRVVRTESEVQAGPSVIPFSTEYHDFRLVDGVLVAFREETRASGIHTATTVIDRATVERATPPAARRRPRARPRCAPGAAPAP